MIPKQEAGAEPPVILSSCHPVQTRAPSILSLPKWRHDHICFRVVVVPTDNQMAPCPPRLKEVDVPIAGEPRRSVLLLGDNASL